MKLLDRYVLRNFLEPFLICLSGFIAIWLIIDFSDNNNDFLAAHASLKMIAGFYLTQLPATILLSLPIGLLLALLFSLSSMSRRNEIISMLASGRSVPRVLLPLFFVGVIASGFCLWLNWEMAPHAESNRKNAMRQMKQMSRGKEPTGAEIISGHVFINRKDSRAWYVRKLRIGSKQLGTVQIIQQNPEGDFVRKYYADSTEYEAATRTWKLSRGMIASYNESGDITTTDYFLDGSRIISDWSETPWRVASSQLDASSLSIPELRSYLEFNSDFPEAQLAPYRTNLADRYAWPINCLVVILIAAPLGIVFNRRGVLGGVATALTLFVILLLSRFLFLAFGKGDRLPPDLAPWIPDIVGAAIGFVLLWFRSTSREMPSFRRLKVPAPKPASAVPA